MRLIDFSGLRAHETARIDPDVKYYGSGSVEIGAHSRIDSGSILLGNIIIGRRVHIAPYSMLFGKNQIVMHDYSGVGCFTVMHTESDIFDGSTLTNPCVPREHVKKIEGPIIVGRHVIIGARCTIMPNVYFDPGSALGAHSLVLHDQIIPTLAIYVGTPAKFLSMRSSELFKLEEKLEAEEQ